MTDTDTVEQELDTVVNEHEGETMLGVVAHLENTFGVRAEVINEFGPAGGNPIFKLTGERAAVRRAMQVFWGFSDEDLADWGY